ncbi:MAG: cell envelope biogenesis protein OmpA [Bacteroidota bacterium]
MELDTPKNTDTKNEKELLDQLKSILLQEDREEIEKVKETIYVQENLSEEISPIVKSHIEDLKNNFPKEFRLVVDEMITKKIESSQEEIVNAIYPEVGKMIKKYVGHQIQMLKEGIENRIRNTFDSKSFWGKMKARFGWRKTSDEIIQSLAVPVVEEIFIIQKDSGLLAGSATRNDLVDQDVVAGMLTAIKAFVEDAFNQGNEDLETIEYGSYRIVLQNFPKWYMAVALSGTLSSKEKDELSDQILDFASAQMPPQLDEINDTLQKDLSTKLEQHFIKEKVAAE